MLAGFLLCYFTFNIILLIIFLHTDLKRYQYSTYKLQDIKWGRIIVTSIIIIALGMVEILRKIIKGELK